MLAFAKKNVAWIVAGVAILWLFYVLGSHSLKTKRRVVVGPGKAPNSTSPAAISPQAGGVGGLQQPFSPARAATATDDRPTTAFTESLIEGGTIAGQIVAEKLEGTFNR